MAKAPATKTPATKAPVTKAPVTKAPGIAIFLLLIYSLKIRLEFFPLAMRFYLLVFMNQVRILSAMFLWFSEK